MATLPLARWPVNRQPVNFSPIDNALANIAKTNAINRDTEIKQDAGARIAAGDTTGAENELFKAGYLDQGINLQNTAATQKRNAAQDQALLVNRAGGLAQIGLQQADPARKAAILSRVFSLDPKMKDSISADGVDISNPDAVFQYVQNEAAGYKGYQNPEDVEAKTLGNEKTRAEIAALKQKADDPLAAFLANRLNPQTATPGAPAASPPTGGTVQPQSFEGAPQQPTVQTISNVQPVPGNAQPQTAPQLNPGVVLTGNEASSPAPEVPQQSPGAVYSLPGNETVNTPLGPMTRDQARTMGAYYAAKGKGEFGRMMMDSASGGSDKLGKTGANQNDKNSISTVDAIAGLDNIKRAYNAKFLNIPARIGYAWKGLVSKLGSIDPKDAQELKDYATFRAAAFDQLNKKMKELSGTAVTPQEAQRQLMVLPNAGQGIGDGDSPPEFEAKMDASIAWTKAAYARQNYLRNQGFQGKPWEAGLSVEDMPKLINQRGQQLRQQLQQQFPKASPMQLDKTVTQKIKQEFGI